MKQVKEETVSDLTVGLVPFIYVGRGHYFFKGRKLRQTAQLSAQIS